MARHPGKTTPRTPRGACHTLALAASTLLGLSTVIATANTATAAPTPSCLWAGDRHPQGDNVIAGGWTFTCVPATAAPQWQRGAATDASSTVPNPGATTNPSGLFSPGAVQPGTEYTDYCVGTQLVDGSEAMYEVTLDSSGTQFWKAAGPIAEWRFDPGTTRIPSTQSASICPPDPVIDPNTPPTIWIPEASPGL